MEKFDYSDLIDRNWGFIAPDLQKKIRSTTLLFAGCGLGSTIAETAARLGFSKFILADGDVIEVSNLNRQSFTTSMVGVNKARALEEVITHINPEAEITVFDQFVKNGDVSRLVEQSDFIINTVDAGEVYFQLAEEGQGSGKTVLLPLNIGFGGFLWVLNESSSTLSDLLGTKILESDLMLYERIFARMNKEEIPNYIVKMAEDLFTGMSKKENSPQTVIGARIVSALVITTVVKILNNEAVKHAPHFEYVDVLNSNEL
jgi:molybdopterin/thiamine biosynthesis adenylyltransferase